MTASNLGLVFAPAVFSEEAGITLPAHAWKVRIMFDRASSIEDADVSSCVRRIP